MKVNEAIEKLNSMERAAGENVVVLQLAQVALEKQIPKALIIRRKIIGDERCVKIECCPSCYKHITTFQYDWCTNCGQRLDFQGEKVEKAYI